MEWIDDFEPVSNVSGNIELTFNKKNKEFDKYEPIKNQLVLTIGKTGRANRLTFDKPGSDELIDTAEKLLEIADRLQCLENIEEEKEEAEFKASEIEKGVK